MFDVEHSFQAECPIDISTLITLIVYPWPFSAEGIVVTNAVCP